MTQPTFTKPFLLPSRDHLNAAEKAFVKCMEQGIGCHLNNDLPTEAIDEGENANVIRADVIGFFACGGDDRMPTHGNVLYLHGAWVSGPLRLPHTHVPCALRFIKCHFSKAMVMNYSECPLLDLDGSLLSYGLMGSKMQINNNISMSDGFASEDEVYLPDANIGGNLFCMGGTFKGTNKSALNADRIKIGGDLRLDNSAAEGAVSLASADIGSNLNCDNGRFRNKGGAAIIINRSEIRGNAFLRNVVAEGAVRLIGANIGGNLNCDGGRFNNGNNYTLAMNRAMVGGNVFLRDNFTSAGEVRLPAAKIGGNLCCDDGTFNGKVNAKSATIENSLRWQKVNGGGTVNLSFASVDVLDDDKESREKFDFILSGFSYAQLADYADVKSRIDWLNRRPKSVPFSPQPFEQAADVYYAMGQDTDAQEVLLEKERLVTKELRLHPLHKAGRLLWSLFSGYGYRLRWTLMWALGIILTSMMFFHVADKNCRIFPHQPVVIANEQYKSAKVEECSVDYQPTQTVADLFPEYPQFNALAYSADVFIPFFALHQESHWYPQPQEGDNIVFRILLRFWYWIEIIAGWGLTSLLALTVTGVLTRKKPKEKK